MFKKVNVLKFNFSSLNKKFCFITNNRRLENIIIGDASNSHLIKRNLPFYNKFTIKNFTKKANKRKGDQPKDNENEYTNKKIARKKSKESKDKGNHSDLTDIEDDFNLKANKNKNKINAEVKIVNPNKNNEEKEEEINTEKKTNTFENMNRTSDTIKCMIIHPVFSDR